MELYCRRGNSEENWKNLIAFPSSKVEDDDLWDVPSIIIPYLGQIVSQHFYAVLQ